MIVQAVEQYVFDIIGRSGAGPMPPAPTYMRKNWNFSSLENHRGEADQIIGQGKIENNPIIVDGGDSAHKTGVLAFLNSQLDQDLLPRFEIGPGYIVRHPTDTGDGHNTGRNFTRDQLIAYVAGLWRAGRTDIGERVLRAHSDRNWRCQNVKKDTDLSADTHPDVLNPHDIMTLRIAAGDVTAYADPLGQLTLEAAVRLAPRAIEEEKTNLLLECIICGKLDLYVDVHDNYQDNIRYYWCGWRHQDAIGEALIEAVEFELERYKGRPSYLSRIPHHLIEWLQDTGSWLPTAKLTIGDISRLATLTLQFQGALARDIFEYEGATEALYIADLLAKAGRIEAAANALLETLKAGRPPAEIMDDLFNALRQVIDPAGVPGLEFARLLAPLPSVFQTGEIKLPSLGDLFPLPQSLPPIKLW